MTAPILERMLLFVGEKPSKVTQTNNCVNRKIVFIQFTVQMYLVVTNTNSCLLFHDLNSCNFENSVTRFVLHNLVTYFNPIKIFIYQHYVID